MTQLIDQVNAHCLKVGDLCYVCVRTSDSIYSRRRSQEHHDCAIYLGIGRVSGRRMVSFFTDGSAQLFKKETWDVEIIGVLSRFDEVEDG